MKSMTVGSWEFFRASFTNVFKLDEKKEYILSQRILCYALPLSPQVNMGFQLLSNSWVCPRSLAQVCFTFARVFVPEQRILYKGQRVAKSELRFGLSALSSRWGKITLTYFWTYSSSEFKMLAMWEATKFFTCSFCSNGRSWVILLTSDWEGSLISMR